MKKIIWFFQEYDRLAHNNEIVTWWKDYFSDFFFSSVQVHRLKMPIYIL